MKQMFQINKSCPIHPLDLEGGHTPARFQTKKNANYYIGYEKKGFQKNSETTVYTSSILILQGKTVK